MHIMWDCPKIHDFWNKVLQSLSDLIDIQLPMDPVYIFSMMTLNLKA